MNIGTRLGGQSLVRTPPFLIEKSKFLIYIAIQQFILCETNKQILNRKNQEIGIQGWLYKGGVVFW